MSENRPLLLWPDGDLSAAPERWIRLGECARCGACCEDEDRPHYLVGLLDDADDDAVDADDDAVDADDDVGADDDNVEAGGGAVDAGDRAADLAGCSEAVANELPPGPVVAEDWDGRWVFWRPSGVRHGPCPKWQGGGVCSVYGTDDFPHVCRKWPVLPFEMEAYPACGYRFTRRSTGST